MHTRLYQSHPLRRAHTSGLAQSLWTRPCRPHPPHLAARTPMQDLALPCKTGAPPPRSKHLATALAASRHPPLLPWCREHAAAPPGPELGQPRCPMSHMLPGRLHDRANHRGGSRAPRSEQTGRAGFLGISVTPCGGGMSVRRHHRLQDMAHSHTYVPTRCHRDTRTQDMQTLQRRQRQRRGHPHTHTHTHPHSPAHILILAHTSRVWA